MRGLISAFRPWRGRHGGTLGQEVKQEAEAETMQAGTLLAVLLTGLCSASFPVQAWPPL